MNYFIESLHALYPQAVRTVGEEAFDVDGNPVVYDRAAVQHHAAIEQVRRKRAAAYAAESDPIFFKAQRGEATMDDWRVMVASIQLSIPYPDEEVTP